MDGGGGGKWREKLQVIIALTKREAEVWGRGEAEATWVRYLCSCCLLMPACCMLAPRAGAWMQLLLVDTCMRAAFISVHDTWLSLKFL